MNRPSAALRVCTGPAEKLAFWLGVFPGALLGSVGEIETSGLTGALVEVLEAGDDFFDEVADAVVVGGEVVPVDFCGVAEEGGGDACDDRGFAAQVGGNRWE